MAYYALGGSLQSSRMTIPDNFPLLGRRASLRCHSKVYTRRTNLYVKSEAAAASPSSTADEQREKLLLPQPPKAIAVLNNNIVPKSPKPVVDPTEDASIVQELVAKVAKAQRAYAVFSQEQVDTIFKAAAAAANSARIPLAKLAVQETGMGLVEDKVIKNHFASEYVYNKYKGLKTCGIIEEDEPSGIQKIAEPVGVICGIVPVTNPTSTAIFKCLIALKTRNALVLSPHPKAAKATIEAARIVRDAAVAAGAPPDIIAWVEQPTSSLSGALMRCPGIQLILATGGPGMVSAAYSSGHPSIGVGAGNTPAVIDDTADVRMAVSSIAISKTFDNGVICASEQSIIVADGVYDAVKQEFVHRGAYFLNEEEKSKVAAKLLVQGRLNPEIVGQSVFNIGALCGLDVPAGTRLLIGEVSVIGKEEPFSFEKLCPILAMYRASSFTQAVEMAERLIEFGGPGHTSVLYTNPDNRSHIDQFETHVKTTRVLINTPSSQGGIGDLYNFHLDPSLTLGCGTWGSTSVSANVGPQHLLNIKTVTARRENMLWFRVPPKIFFKRGCLEFALRDLAGYKRAFVVTDKALYELGMSDQVTRILADVGLHSQVFYDVEPDPSLDTVERGLKDLRLFKPDVIIALGGGSPMDAAKVMWLMYEHPETRFEGLSMRFMDIRKRVYDVPTLGQQALFVAIPTTSGTGSEVTPFSVVTDQNTGVKFPLADYALTPSMAIVDPQLTMHMPRALTAAGGIDAVTHALESYVSVCATDYTMGLSRESLKLLFQYLPRAYRLGHDDAIAREKVHYAATIAGMAFANAFLGICHSMAHKLGSAMHVPHGVANALLISHVIRYNATDAPFKQAIFPQYQYPHAKSAYAELADFLGLGGSSEDEKVVKLIEAIEALKAEIGIPATIAQYVGVDKKAAFESVLDDMAEQAFDDQCTGANPRYPLISDLRHMLATAWDTPVLALNLLDWAEEMEKPQHECEDEEGCDLDH